MERDLLRVIQICIGIVVLFATSYIVFSMFPLMNSEVGAAWIQAIGSIASIWVAIAVVRMQAKETYRQIERDAMRHSLSTLTAIATEIGTHLETVKSAAQRIATAEAQGKISQFPSFNPRFYILENAASTLGRVDDQALVSEIISCYSEIDLFFDSMNRRTECARLLPGDLAAQRVPQNSAQAELWGEFLALTESVKRKCDRISAWHANICQRLSELDKQYAQKIGILYQLDARILNTIIQKKHK